MKYLILSTFTLLLFACASEAQQPQAKEKEDAIPAAVPGMETSKETGLLFFSKQAAITAQKDTLNLCSAKFETTVPLFPVGSDPNKRYFEVEKGVYVVSFNAGNTRTTFMLKANGPRLELMTSAQYPYCLSQQSNFHFNETQDGFIYDGGRYTRFGMTATPTEKGFRVDLFWDQGKQFGLFVRSRLAGS